MNRWTTSLRVATISVLGFGLIGCGDDDDTTGPGEGTGTIVLQFEHRVDTANLALNTGEIYTNAAGNAYNVTKLQYLLSDFVFHGEEETLRDHDDFALNHVQLVDMEDTATHTWTINDVPAGNYEELHLRFGLDEDSNTAGAYPQYDQQMAWPEPLGGGYHYMKLEGSYDGTGSYATHLGHNRDSNQVLTDHSFEIELDLEAAEGLRHGSISVSDGETVTIRVIMNVNNWYVNPNMWDFSSVSGPIMPDHAAQVTFSQNGQDVFSTVPVE